MPDSAPKVLHFGPEKPLADYLSSIYGDGYTMADLSRSRYAPMAKEMGVEFRRVDLCRDLHNLPNNYYDLVLHSHVLEHVPCNYADVLKGLQALVRPGGAQLFAVPIWRKGSYREDLSPELSPEERWKLFGRHNHFRHFAVDDLHETIGSVFDLEGTQAKDCFTPDELASVGAPPDYPGTFFIAKAELAKAS